MKKTIRYDVNETTVEKEIDYIPFRYIIAVMITLVWFTILKTAYGCTTARCCRC